MRKNPVNKTLEKLKKQKAVIEARIQATQARAKVSERKQETRRKILIGAYYLEHARQTNNLSELQHIMANYLTRNSDRKLFDLPELTKEK